MKIKLASVSVGNQEKALQFYTGVLGFVKKADITMGEYRWLTVTSSEEPDETELVLEPMAFPPSVVYQQALFAAGIPATAFKVEDVEKEFERLQKLGVEFSTKPTNMGMVTIAKFSDTCGNHLQIFQV
ncbi:VOC family protein [Mucilaginibacter sp.]|uniref:VOC family protein n=1 Tax=Mucilaginibacter sp. TaxID=1882438 RepID=UPI003D1045B9